MPFPYRDRLEGKGTAVSSIAILNDLLALYASFLARTARILASLDFATDARIAIYHSGAAGIDITGTIVRKIADLILDFRFGI
ncbi:hypothetical protein QUA56_10430 [Microcoleus sp. N3A4]|uniref:hypothetical protein n=1 Tax=Microcoleus sp. N3A4 TaxID=3055379 RepID=UPI002FD54147